MVQVWLFISAPPKLLSFSYLLLKLSIYEYPYRYIIALPQISPFTIFFLSVSNVVMNWILFKNFTFLFLIYCGIKESQQKRQRKFAMKKKILARHSKLSSHGKRSERHILIGNINCQHWNYLFSNDIRNFFIFFLLLTIDSHSEE